METFRYFTRAYPWQSVTVLVCLLVAGLMEGLGLSVVVPLLGVVLRGDGAAAPSGFEASVAEVFARFGFQPSFEVFVGFVCLVFPIKAVLVLLSNRRVGYMVAQVATDLRLGLLRALLASRWSYYTRMPLGLAPNAMASEATRAAQAYYCLSQVLSGAFEVLFAVAVASAISWRVTLAAAAGGAVTIGGLNVFVRMTKRAGLKQTLVLRSLVRQLTDVLQALKILKATGRDELIGPLLEKDTQRLNKALRKQVLSKEFLKALQEPVLVLFGMAGLWAGHRLLGIPPALLIVLVLVFGRTLLAIHKMQRKYQDLVVDESALAALRSMIETAEREREVDSGSRPPSLAKAIELRGVGLAYDGRPVFDGLDLEIPRGSITAIIGPSGSGKTTIVDLVTGLLVPDAGRVLLDGVPLGETDLRAWRRCVGYVTQETLLFNDTIRTNVTLGDPALGDAETERALRDAGAWGFVTARPEGLDAPVGERGAMLSGGQRQRIAIARALVHRPQLLILDEATAALDPDAEAAVWATVSELRGKTTVVAISHQPTLLGAADRTYRIEKHHAARVEQVPAA